MFAVPCGAKAISRDDHGKGLSAPNKACPDFLTFLVQGRPDAVLSHSCTLYVRTLL